jgi:hypothetical protein
MSTLHCRGSIAGAVVVVALLSSRPAVAQIGIDPGPPREPRGWCNDLITGVKYDVLNQALAEWHLQHVQAKLSRDAERGDMAAVDCDVRRIENLRYRIVIDEWLIRWNAREYPCFYPIRTDEVSRAAIAQAATPTIPITIVNAAPAGSGVAFAIDGVAHQAPAGSRQDLDVAPGSKITYDGGGSLGQRRYRISPGRYEFRSTAEGWALYKLAAIR